MVDKARKVIASEGWGQKLSVKGCEGTFWSDEMFHILTEVWVTWVNAFVKTHPVTHVRSVHFTL